MSDRSPSVLELCITRGGVRKGTRTATFIAQWTIAQQALGHAPTLEEVAAWWKENPGTWYRRQNDFRAIFDQVENPASIAAELIAQGDDQAVKLADALASLGRIDGKLASA